MSDAIFYQDTYHHAIWAAPIVHFGINSHNQSIRSSLTTHNTTQQPAMSASGVQSNVSSRASEYQKFSAVIIPTIYEQDLVRHAIYYLTNATAPHKVVLVDVLPRALTAVPQHSINLGDIKVPSDPNVPILTHAVVLYKNSQGQVLVIDPNNPQFSGHLQHLGRHLQANIE
jgi:hypothetical protein